MYCTFFWYQKNLFWHYISLYGIPKTILRIQIIIIIIICDENFGHASLFEIFYPDDKCTF